MIDQKGLMNAGIIGVAVVASQMLLGDIVPPIYEILGTSVGAVITAGIGALVGSMFTK